MAVKSFTESEFKQLIKSTFDRLRDLPPGVAIEDGDINNSFDWATAQLDYDVPDSGDTQSQEKLKWLDNRMKSYLYNLLILSYAVITDFQKSKSRQLFEGFVKLRGLLDKDFAEVYIDIEQGPMVRSSGFINSKYGEDLTYAELETIDRESGTVRGIDDV